MDDAPNATFAKDLAAVEAQLEGGASLSPEYIRKRITHRNYASERVARLADDKADELAERLYTLAMETTGAGAVRAIEALLRISREEREIQLLEERQAEKLETSALRVKVAETLERLSQQGRLPAGLVESLSRPATVGDPVVERNGDG